MSFLSPSLFFVIPVFILVLKTESCLAWMARRPFFVTRWPVWAGRKDALKAGHWFARIAAAPVSRVDISYLLRAIAKLLLFVQRKKNRVDEKE